MFGVMVIVYLASESSKFWENSLRTESNQGKEQAQKQFLTLGKQPKSRPFATVKGLRANTTVVPHQSVNPRLEKILEKVLVKQEVLVCHANTNVKEMLEVWFTNINRVGITNYLVAALDDETA
ncbi:hypothetical protein GLYMA_15G229700v4 [Glycine max]|uniref:Uncharacterized protein n=2 Tax=Glycine subgen. Soja TaxID=1462606 RepID=K7MDA7_SOYBN|nr:hypothetical protein JHK87_043304 [Glycine soja]KAH1148502.1 hypothetical protein GYH30_043229 [Glycine max]KRH13303.1 hypothetical protein GLYMA_15G229700v4 [Glycine max]